MYRAGFATAQEAYDKAVWEVFAGLDRVEEILSRKRYLTGSAITEADVRLYTTLVRFDPVYVGHFKVGYTSASQDVIPDMNRHSCCCYYFSVTRRG